MVIEGDKNTEDKEVADNYTRPQFRGYQPTSFLSAWDRACFCQIAEHPDAMATALAGKLQSSSKKKKKGGELFTFPSQTQTCVVAAELSRGHTTHVASFYIF